MDYAQVDLNCRSLVEGMTSAKFLEFPIYPLYRSFVNLTPFQHFGYGQTDIHLNLTVEWFKTEMLIFLPQLLCNPPFFFLFQGVGWTARTYIGNMEHFGLWEYALGDKMCSSLAHVKFRYTDVISKQLDDI